MKTIETEFEKFRNKACKENRLKADFDQNKNDYSHRQIHDPFIYKYIDSQTGRIKFLKKFILLNSPQRSFLITTDDHFMI